MADFSLPVLTSQYAAFIDAIKANDATVARWFDGTTDTNIPTGAKGWSTANKRFEMFDGTTWGPLVPNDSNPDNAYGIRVERANECSGNAATAGIATNALNLGDVPADQYVVTGDTRLADSRQCNNTFENAATSRAALSVSSQAEVAVALALKANLESPALTGAPTCPTLTAGTNGNNSTRLANTAFVNAAIRAFLHDALPSSDGYMRFRDPDNSGSSGIIIQWGSCLGSEDAWGYRPYPIQFPHDALAIVGSKADPYIGTNTHITVDLWSNSTFRVFSNAYPGNGQTPYLIRWIAIGY